MNKQAFPRLGPACGVLFPVGLFAASGHHAYAIGLAAIVLFLPFLAYLTSLLRQAEGEGGWLATTAFAAGLTGIILKLVSVTPEIAIHKHHIATGSSLHTALQGIADAATLICLYPLGLMLAAVAILALRSHVLPRWLATGAAVTSVALIVNGSFINADFVPALLLFLLWTLVASVVLLRRTWGQRSQFSEAQPAGAR